MSRSAVPMMAVRGGVLLVVAWLLLVGGSLTAQAFPQAAWPTQSKGSRGADVEAIQQLLVHAGQTVAVDGDFGSGTDAAVRAFQTARGLGADGRVGPNTWGALAVSLRQGDNNNAVRALQRQLNVKRGLGLSVDGSFGPGTYAAVVDFQRHAGIEDNGEVGPITWRNLIWHYQLVDRPEAAAICTKASDVNGDSAHWGTAAAVGQLTAAAGRVYSSGLGPVAARDLSFEHGGNIPDHASHEVGLDADVQLMRNDHAQCTGTSRISRFDAQYSRTATRELIQAIRATGRVKVIFFNDPVLIGEGLVQSQDNHDDHLHVRYCESVHPNSSYSC
ncbi:penicillin-insensitive murein endopeptidase [Kribbella sp. NPDC056951]|uniref:penicillin-insensitive murein endopeptidase n=1 Tax=Kribbella sp. NPDC056951 TaxID=3345978 RepID=UPI0036428AA7